MATIRKEITIPTDPADAWDAIRDFGGVHERLAAGFVTATRMDGGDRIVTFVNGSSARERLVAVDEDRRRLVYSVVDSGLGFAHHQASAEVVDGEGGETRFIWTTDLLPDELAPVIDQMMDQGAEAITRPLGG